MKSRRIFKESYVSNNILSSKIPISPKEESYNSKSSTYKSITKYTKKDVDMIIKIQRWWRSILPKLNKFNKIENSYSKRHIESTRIKKHYSNSSFNDRRINKYENNSNHYKYLSNSLNSNLIIISVKIKILNIVIIQTLQPVDQIIIISKHRQSQEKVRLVLIPNVVVYPPPPRLKVNI